MPLVKSEIDHMSKKYDSGIFKCKTSISTSETDELCQNIGMPIVLFNMVTIKVSSC
jgi:hypothetical protein